MRSHLLVTMIADIFGYSRLTESDERTIIEKILDYNERLIFPTIHQYSGNVVKNTGDGFLATFHSPSSVRLVPNKLSAFDFSDVQFVHSLRFTASCVIDFAI